MDSLATSPGLHSVEEYLELEERFEIRHEYVGGMLHPVSGQGERHNQIALNVAIALREAARGTPCRVAINDMWLQIGDIYYYPVVMISCRDREADNPTSWREPCVLVEVLSPSSEVTDRREKLLNYRSIPTLHAYLIVHHDTRRVERHFRDDEGEWQRGDLVNDASVPVPCVDTRLALAAIYEEV